MNGVVRAESTVLTAFVLPVEEIFYRFIKNREWDVSVMSFGKFIGYASQRQITGTHDASRNSG